MTLPEYLHPRKDGRVQKIFGLVLVRIADSSRRAVRNDKLLELCNNRLTTTGLRDFVGHRVAEDADAFDLNFHDVSGDDRADTARGSGGDEVAG